MPRQRISTEQMIALHGFFAEALAVGEASLAELCGCETELELTEVRCTTLADFGERGLQLGDDLVAGVMARMEGPVPGSLGLVVEPEEALVWARTIGDPDPLACFVSLGDELLSGIAAALSALFASPAEVREPRLVELPELALLVQTHAPLDTLVVSLRLRVALRDEVVSAHVHLLIEPKYLARILSALSAAVH